MKLSKRQVLALITAIALVVLQSCGADSEKKEITERMVPVAVDTVRLKPFQIDYHSIGRVVSENQVMLLFQSSGQVDSIWAQVGDYVVNGQRLASIERDIYATMYTQTKSMFEKAKRDMESSRSLFDSHVISSDQFEMARIGLDNARAGYTQAKDALDNTILRAPFSGWIVTKNLNVGDLVAPGAAMQPPYVLADMNQLKIIVPVPEARIGQIKKGQRAQIKFKTFPDREFSGRVLRVALAPKDFSNNYDVEVRLNGNLRGLKLGLIADVRIVLEYFEEALVLPLRLVQDDGVSQFTYTEEDGRAVRQEVSIKALAGSEVLIESAISAGDMIITKGHNDVKAGTLLDIVE